MSLLALGLLVPFFLPLYLLLNFNEKRNDQPGFKMSSFKCTLGQGKVKHRTAKAEYEDCYAQPIHVFMHVCLGTLP